MKLTVMVSIELVELSDSIGMMFSMIIAGMIIANAILMSVIAGMEFAIIIIRRDSIRL